MSQASSLITQPCHLLVLSLRKPRTQFEKGMFIVSIDVDVGSRELGLINKGKNDCNIRRKVGNAEYKIGQVEEAVTPLFIEIFDDFGLPATFAIRGQLTEVKNSILHVLLESQVKHDIGAHGYYHRPFKSVSRNEAEKELRMISVGMKEFGIVPKSFVFPKNSVNHLGLLEKYQYRCYRGSGGLLRDEMYIEKKRKLYDIHPSLYIDQHFDSLLLRKILDIAIAWRAPLHLWFHLWSFGLQKDFVEKNVNRVFLPLLEYAKRKEKMGVLTFETMLSACERIEKQSLF